MCEVQVFTFTSTMCLVQVFTFTSTLRRIFSRIHTHIHTHTHTHTHLHTPTGGQGNEEGWLSQCIQCTDTHTDIHRHHSVWSVLTHVPHPHVAPLSLSLVGMQDVKKNKQALWTAVYVGMVQVCCTLCLCCTYVFVCTDMCARGGESVSSFSLLLSFVLLLSPSLALSRPLLPSLALSCPLLPSPCVLCHATGLSCCVRVRVRVRVDACECAQAGGTHATARRH